MSDNLTPEKRSWNMSRIRAKDTKPELTVRSMLHRAGYRFTVNGNLNRSLPGKPDIVLPRYRTVVFVHGCFWHQHPGCKAAKIPKSSSAGIDWNSKLSKNLMRDKKQKSELQKLGWQVLTVWECQCWKEPLDVLKRLTEKLNSRIRSG
jgi:DNA mismatch endonuclease (patch repair protein)